VIVGIVQNFRQRTLDGSPQAEIYVPQTQFSSAGMFLAVRARSGKPGTLIPSVRAELRALDRNLPIAAMRTGEELLGATLSPRRFSLVLLSIFAATALALSVVGVYGVLSFAVSQRTKEIGIRIALGAARRDVLRLISWQGMVPVLLGLVLGLGAAIGATRVLTNTLFEIRPSDPGTLLGVALILLGAAVAAVWIPARRASRIDPLIALQ
jgi:ABC-type antimicrobial peptide transport system permease subunit